MSDHSYSMSEQLLCPFCGHEQTSDLDEVGAYVEGDHETECERESCGLEFTFATTVSYSYSSSTPAYNESRHESLAAYDKAVAAGHSGRDATRMYWQSMSDKGFDPWA